MTTEGQQFLYLTTRGWKTNRPHEIEIWFVGHDGKYYVVSERGKRSHWVQNIRSQPSISFRVGARTSKGNGRIVDRRKELELAGAVSALMDEKYKWSRGLIVELAPGQ
ncbi:MAG: nitroreductase family deazaflavin-dependent oxidoreductase [Nitrososphaerales archaeon]|nr:nitroreductase family deazaflavin-dependent oxidoreductase [Nitrososphaerales archaeon]